VDRFLLIVSLVLVLSSPEIVHSQAAAPEELYRDGKLAYERGDCPTAIEKLSAFRAKSEDKIESHMDFFALIDEKIEACKHSLATGIHAIGGRTTFGATF